ncbi:hypothetical protein [Nakamurella sp.]|uniref:hypothetical protein n=1 Tax=Nakamurella sp. TaxID=1869182 RepID=UPI003783F74E
MTGIPAASPDAGPGPGEPTRRLRAWRWGGRLVALVVLAVTIMMIALAIGMRLNDRAIDEHPGSANATVLSVSPLRTGIEFVDGTGATIRPEGGVLYPGLLSVGQQFVVEYSTVDPQIARVAGRTAAVGTIMIAVTLAVTYLVAVPLLWWCHRRARMPMSRLLFGARRPPGHAAVRPASTV